MRPGQSGSMDIVAALQIQGGVARRGTLLAQGVPRQRIDEALSTQRILRPARGVYALPGSASALVSAACAGAELACITAAKHLGLWVFREPTFVHVTVDHGRPLEGVFRVHRQVKPLSLADICVQSMRCLPELDALCIVESAVVQKRVSLEQLRASATGARDAPLRRIIGLVDPHAESILETVARYRLGEEGLHVSSQVYIPGVGRLDLFVEGILGIEADGREHHSGHKEFEEDRRRWNLLTVKGIPILRVSAKLILREPDSFIRLVRQGLASRKSQ